MRHRSGIIAFLVLASLAIPLVSVIHAQWAYLSPEELAYFSDLVVYGKLSDKKDDAKALAVAKLTVKQVLKGDAGVKEVTLHMPGNNGVQRESCGGDIVYKGDEEGVWFLEQKVIDGKTYYKASYPTRFVNASGLGEAQLKDKLEWAAKVVKAAEPKEIAIEELAKAVTNKTVEARAYRVHATLERKVEKHGEGAAAREWPQWYLVDGNTRMPVNMDYRIGEPQAEAALKAGGKLDVDVLAVFLDYNKTYSEMKVVKLAPPQPEKK